jgi:hypothetical protein
MLKHLALAALGLVLIGGTAVAAPATTATITVFAQTQNRDLPPNLLYEGRSNYLMEDPGSFYGGSDEKGYPSGDPQNPHTGN